MAILILAATLHRIVVLDSQLPIRSQTHFTSPLPPRTAPPTARLLERVYVHLFGVGAQLHCACATGEQQGLSMQYVILYIFIMRIYSF
jgi:hypothetical protein